MSDAMMAETIRIRGHDDDDIPAYFARPLGDGPYGAVIVLHHMPGWDEATKEITRTFAANGYLALCPNLHFREKPDASSPSEAALRDHGKTYEFHTYENAGHAFFSVDRPTMFRADAALDGWEKIWSFFGRYL